MTLFSPGITIYLSKKVKSLHLGSSRRRRADSPRRCVFGNAARTTGLAAGAIECVNVTQWQPGHLRPLTDWTISNSICKNHDHLVGDLALVDRSRPVSILPNSMIDMA